MRNITSVGPSTSSVHWPGQRSYLYCVCTHPSQIYKFLPPLLALLHNSPCSSLYFHFVLPQINHNLIYFLASVPSFFSPLNWSCFLHYMLEGENSNYYRYLKKNGQSKLCTAPFGRVAAFTWFPFGNCASTASNFQFEWHIFLLLPLGQASVSPSILRQRHRSRSRRRPFIFEI